MPALPETRARRLLLILAPFALVTFAAARASAEGVGAPAKPTDAPLDKGNTAAGSRFPNGGDLGAYLIERYGGLVLPSATRGASGGAYGSGLEARYIMPVGWGGYARFTRVRQDNQKCGDDCYVWDHWDVTLGLSRRLQATPQRPAFREHTRFDLGFAYSQANTSLSCDGQYTPWSISCTSGASARHRNASGSALGIEARLAVEIGVGPVALGLDVGGGAFKSLTHGENSEPLPTVFFAWSAQARAGLSWSIE
jgi:hypothetical protein